MEGLQQEELFTIGADGNFTVPDSVQSIAPEQPELESKSNSETPAEVEEDQKTEERRREMKVKPEDVQLVKQVCAAISNSKLGKVTPDYLITRGNLPGSVTWEDLQHALKKYFRHAERGSSYYVPKDGLEFPEASQTEVPETNPELPIPPNTSVPTNVYKGPWSGADAYERAVEEREEKVPA